MSLKVYAYKNCSTCRKALKFLDAHGISYEVVPIREKPPTKKELKAMLGHVGGELKKLFNTSGVDYRSLNMKDKLPTLSEKEALDLLASNGNLVKRPFAISARNGAIGFREDKWCKRFT